MFTKRKILFTDYSKRTHARRHTRTHAHTHTHTQTRTQEAAHTTYQLLFPSYLTTGIQSKKQKRLTSSKTCSTMEYCRKRQDRKSKKTRQKNKRGDRKGESDDSPEIREGVRQRSLGPLRCSSKLKVQIVQLE